MSKIQENVASMKNNFGLHCRYVCCEATKNFLRCNNILTADHIRCSEPECIDQTGCKAKSLLCCSIEMPSNSMAQELQLDRTVFWAILEALQCQAISVHPTRCLTNTTRPNACCKNNPEPPKTSKQSHYYHKELCRYADRQVTVILSL